MHLRFVNGEMAEWFKAAVLKTVVGQPTGGSNPSLSAITSCFTPESFLNQNRFAKNYFEMKRKILRVGEMAEWLKARPC